MKLTDTSIQVGIEKIGLYIPEYYIDLKDLAERRDVDPNKYLIGIGQGEMAVAPLWQDIVSMGANAANDILNDYDREKIDQILFATESSFDYSKSAASYLPELLNIQSSVKCYEVKHACYSGTAALMTACDYVRLRPDKKVLVVMSDISKYGLGSGGEVTQGAGSMALLISSQPQIMTVELESVFMTENAYDFWRPEYSSYAFVDGHYSTELYLDMFTQTMRAFFEKYDSASIKAVVTHLPFTKMLKKALDALEEGQAVDSTLIEKFRTFIPAITNYGYRVGNIYTGSLYLGLLSLLVNSDELASGDSLALFSYGSGAVSEALYGTLQPGYREALDIERYQYLFTRRQKLSIDQYEMMYQEQVPQTKGIHVIDSQSDLTEFRLKEVNEDRRYYQRAE